MGNGLSGVEEHGVLWRMQGRHERRLTCQVCEVDGELYLAIRDLDTGKVHVAESCPDVPSLIGRAASARVTYMDDGWRVCS